MEAALDVERVRLRYLQEGKTNQPPAYGPPEDVFTVVDNQFIDFPKEAVCFLQKLEVDDQQVGSLMNTFPTEGDEQERGR